MDNSFDIMENHELILALLQKYRPDHSYETVTNEQGIVELILKHEKEPLHLPLDASAIWSDVKRVIDFYEIYVAKTAKPVIEPQETEPAKPIDLATIEAAMATEAAATETETETVTEAATEAATDAATVTDATEVAATAM